MKGKGRKKGREGGMRARGREIKRRGGSVVFTYLKGQLCKIFCLSFLHQTSFGSHWAQRKTALNKFEFFKFYV
jgi:hypothetical protein